MGKCAKCNKTVNGPTLCRECELKAVADAKRSGKIRPKKPARKK